MEYYPEVERFVIDSFKKTQREELIKHHQRTAYWVKVLNPGADEALLIAAIAHDIERAFYGDTTKCSTSKERIQEHESRSAAVIEKHLHILGADNELVERVRMLVSKHEEGGNDDQNLLKDVDSISFFENNIPILLNKIIRDVGPIGIKNKLDMTYEKITSEKAKSIAKPMYIQSLKELEKVVAEGDFT